MDIILASKSARRIEMMNELGYEYRSIASTKDEFVDSFTSREDLVMKLAKQKALDIYKDNKDSLVLGFDTLVFIDDEILGKPQSFDDCVRMIKRLSGNTHKVVTGAYFIAKDYEESFASDCLVTFEEIRDEDILNYAKTEEPYDKAGGYAVQGFIGRYIKRVEGDFFSVIGMPKSKVNKLLFEYIQKH